MSMRLPSSQWRDIVHAIVAAWGADETVATSVAESLVDSDLCGVGSHGIARVSVYYEHWRSGWLKPNERPRVLLESGATATVDGRWCFGQPAAELAMAVAMERAREFGIAGVGIVRAGHMGRLGRYAEIAAEAGIIGLVAASGGPAGGLMTPHGGSERVLSTNPLAAGAPAGLNPPFVMDFATSKVAAGKLELAPDKNAPIPEGWAVDSQGRPARTAQQFLDGGALLPFGGHKGYALALFVELLCGALTGAGCTERPARIVEEGAGGNAGFVICLDVGHFTNEQSFRGRVDELFGHLAQVRAASGSKGVVIPGQPEAERRALNLERGIEVDDSTWQRLREVAGKCGLDLDSLFGNGEDPNAAPWVRET